MSSNQGVLFLGKVNGESEWLKNDDDDTDGKYLGEIRNGVPEGQGTLTFPDGQKYEGEFHEGQPHGQGTETLPDGEQYVGDWKEGGKKFIKFIRKFKIFILSIENIIKRLKCKFRFTMFEKKALQRRGST